MNIGDTGWEDQFFDLSYKLQSAGAYAITGETYFFPLLNEQDFLKAYRNCPPVKIITNKRAKMFNTGKLKYINTNSEKEVKGQNFYPKTLLDKPNVLQNRDQFQAQQNVYIDVFGYCPVLGLDDYGNPGQYSQIWNIPPWLFDITYTRNWINQNKISGIYKEYFMNWEGELRPLKFDNVHFIFDDGVGTDIDTNLTIPDSRLVGLDYPVSNIIAAYKSRNTLITKRGAIGVLSGVPDKYGAVSFKEGEVDRVQTEFKKYGLIGQPFQVIITEAALKWQQMGFATKDLMLFEEVEESTNALHDAYGYPVELSSRSKGGGLAKGEDKEEAVRAVYRDTIIPESNSRMEQQTQIFKKGAPNISVTRDFSDVPALQEDSKKRGEARKALNEALLIEWENNLITRNMWLEELGESKVDDPEFDKYKKDVEPEIVEDENAPANIGAKEKK